MSASGASTGCRAPAGIRHRPARGAGQRRACRRDRLRRWAAPCWCAWRGPRPCRSNRCTDERTISAARCGSTCRRSSDRPSSENFRCGRSRAACAPSSFPCAGCSWSSTSPGASTRCWSRRRRNLGRRASERSRSCSRRSEAIVRRRATLDDLGLTLRLIEPARTIAVESAAGLLEAGLAAAAERAARETGSEPRSVFTYLANTLRSNNREVPYSLVTAIDPDAVPGAGAVERPAAADRHQRVDGARSRRARRRPADARLHGLGRAGPPGHPVRGFPHRRRRADSRRRGRSHARAGVSRDQRVGHAGGLGSAVSVRPAARPAHRRGLLEAGTARRRRRSCRSMSGSGSGARATATGRPSVSHLRPAASLADARDRYAARLRSAHRSAVGRLLGDRRARRRPGRVARGDRLRRVLHLFQLLSRRSRRCCSPACSSGSASSNARARSGCFAPSGTPPPAFAASLPPRAVVLTAIGSVIGIAGAIGYAAVMIAGLGSWWSGAVGTSALRLHVSSSSLAAGAVGVVVTALACVWWTLRGLSRVSERRLLAGMLAADAPRVDRHTAIAIVARRRRRVRRRWALRSSWRAPTNAIDKTGAFFGAGNSLLVACLCLVAFTLRRPARRPLQGRGWWSVSRLGWRHAADRPGRSVLVVAVIAAATFILISVDAFRRAAPLRRRSPLGRRRVRGAGRSARAAGPRSQRPRRARSAGPHGVPERASRAVPRAAGR